MNYSFLFADLSLLLLTFIVFAIGKLNFVKQRKFIILAVLINVFAFSVPTEFLTQFKAIVYNPPYLLGVTLWGLPAEELLLLFALPLAGIAIYEFLNFKYPDNGLEKYSFAVSNMLLGVCIAMLYFGHQKLYTVFTFFILLVFLIYVEYVNKIRFMYRFYRAFLVSLIPFYGIYGILCALPAVQFTTEETVDFSLANIPFESPFYFMSMLLLSIYLFELFKSRAVK